MTPATHRVTVFGPSPLVSVAIESRGDGAEEIHFHAAGQGVWVSRAVAALGAEPVLCGFAGGEAGRVLRGLLAELPLEARLVDTAGDTGSYVVDRRGGERNAIAQAWAPPPSRHEADSLLGVTTAAALSSEVLVVANPWPADGFPLARYGDLIADVRGRVTTIVDLSTPRLDAALAAGPDVVKLNDWELAELVVGPVGTPGELRAAAGTLLERGAGSVIVTRGPASALAVREDAAWEVASPAFERGDSEGCGDAMCGALAAALARGLPWEESLVAGAAAGAANFLRRGLGGITAEVVDGLAAEITLTRLR